MERVVELRDVSLTLSGREVLKKISLHVQSQERLVLIGPSGHGKSTLLKLVAGLLKPSQGEITRPQSVSMAFQRNGLFDSMSAIDNIIFPLKEMAHPDPKSMARSLLTSVGLLEHAQKRISELSGGQQKRLGIARALATTPELVLYDDPTAGLDPITSFEICELIQEKQKELKHSVLLVTSDVQVAFRLATRMGFLCDGTLMAWGSAEEFRHSKNSYVHQFVEGLETGPLSVI